MSLREFVLNGKSLKIYLLLVFVILCTTFIAAQGVQAAKKLPKAPNFSLPSVPDRKPVELKDYRGKVVLVSFWATWCGPCIKEIPSLNSLQEEYGPKGFSVIGISMDEGGPSVVKKMMKRTGINYPVVMGDRKTGRDFGGIFGIPTSFLIDQSGTIVMRYTGWISHDELEKDIKKVML